MKFNLLFLFIIFVVHIILLSVCCLLEEQVENTSENKYAHITLQYNLQHLFFLYRFLIVLLLGILSKTFSYRYKTINL